MVLLLEGLWQSALLAQWPLDRFTASTQTSDSAGTASWMSGCGFEVFAWFLYAGSTPEMARLHPNRLSPWLSTSAP